MNSIIQRIKSKRKELKLSQAKLAKLIGWTQSRLGNYEAGVRDIDIDSLKELAKALGVSDEWLAYGNGNIPINEVNPNELERFGILLIPEITTTHPDNLGIQEHSEYHQDAPYFPMRKDLFEKLNIEKDNVVALYIHDSVMAPTIRKGAVVLIDTTRKELEEGKLIAWTRSRHVIVRRAIQKPDGWILLADSPIQPTPMFLLPNDEILGKVIWQSSPL